MEHIDCLNLVQLLCYELLCPWTCRLLVVHGVRRGCVGCYFILQNINNCISSVLPRGCWWIQVPRSLVARCIARFTSPAQLWFLWGYKATGLNWWTEPQITTPSVTYLRHLHLISWNLGSLTAFKKREVSCRLSWRLIINPKVEHLHVFKKKKVWLLPCSETNKWF